MAMEENAMLDYLMLRVASSHFPNIIAVHSLCRTLLFSFHMVVWCPNCDHYAPPTACFEALSHVALSGVPWRFTSNVAILYR